MKSLEKMIGILDLFEDAEMEWTPEAMAERLDLTRSTLYRYLKVLADAGLLTSLPGVGYTLGPRIAELDFRMRRSDPLMRGAASTSILAHLPAAVLRKHYEAAPQDFAEAGLGADLDAVRAHLRGIRQRGFAVTKGDLAQGVTGVGSPVFDAKGGVVGSLSLTIGEPDLAPERLAMVAERISSGAAIVSKAIARAPDGDI